MRNNHMRVLRLAALAMLTALAVAELPSFASEGQPRLADVITDKARYRPGEPVRLSAQVSDAAHGVSVALRFQSLGRNVGPEMTASVPSGSAGPWVSFTWTPPRADFRGYRVEVVLRAASGKVLDTGATAVDVSSDWSKFPRYGFVSRFEAGLDTAATVSAMNRYHLNGAQFYDWQWQHHRPYSPQARWPDIANRPVSRATVKGLIAEMHRRGMMAMNYNLVSGAYDNYWSDGSGVKTEWGVFREAANADVEHQDSHSGLPESWATQRIYLFNPADAGWREHIFAEEKKVFEDFAFDGWHIDSLGGRGELWDAKGRPVDLAATYPGFINSAREALNRRMLFNTVGLFGQDHILSDARVDFLYAELWDDAGTNAWADLNRIVEDAQARSEKAIIFAAYMNRGAPEGMFRESSVRLANAVMFAAGAAHIEMGDGDAMLSSEYFPNQKLVMGASLKAAMRDYYDFLVAYQNLLRDGTRAAALRVEAKGIPTSTDGRAGAVWTLTKKRSGYDIVHFLNLENAPESRWRDPEANDPAPDVFTDVPVKVYVTGPFAAEGAVWAASPDAEHGKPRPLDYTTGEDAGGRYVAFTLPRLHYWTMVWLRKMPPQGGAPLSAASSHSADTLRAWRGALGLDQ